MGASARAGGLGRAEESWLPPQPPGGGQWAASNNQAAAGLLLPGSAAQSPRLFLRSVVADGSGDRAKAAGPRLNLDCPRTAVSVATSLAAAAAALLGRCRMNGRTSRRALRVLSTPSWPPRSAGLCTADPDLVRKRGVGLGLARGRRR